MYYTDAELDVLEMFFSGSQFADIIRGYKIFRNNSEQYKQFYESELESNKELYRQIKALEDRISKMENPLRKIHTVSIVTGKPI